MKVVSVVGARPQFVKAAAVSRVLRQRHHEVLIHTGQHYDEAMSATFFRELEMPEPDANLGVGSASHGAQTGEMLARLEAAFAEQAPDGVLVYGDTNSTLAASLAAAKLTLPGPRRPWLAHVEAGLRSFNPAMPEERNRIVTDHLADLLLAPTPTAMANLANEGLADRAELVGDVMVDAYAWAEARAADALPEYAVGLAGFVLLTLHRAENVDDPARLAALLASLPHDRPVIFPIHPRTSAALAEASWDLPSNVRAVAPAGHLAMVALLRAAILVATDSGGLQKEAYLAGTPCVTLRGETEWVESVEAGWNRVAGSDGEALRVALADPAFLDRNRPRPAIFGDGRAAARVVDALERLHRRWAGVARQPAAVTGA